MGSVTVLPQLTKWPNANEYDIRDRNFFFTKERNPIQQLTYNIRPQIKSILVKSNVIAIQANRSSLVPTY